MLAMPAAATGFVCFAAGAAGAVWAIADVVRAEAKMTEKSWNFIDSPLNTKKEPKRSR
jgi:hypothetical protein